MLKEVCIIIIFISIHFKQRIKYFVLFIVPRLLNIETIENCMKLCPMVIQALWEYKSPFMQLPYITEDQLKHFDNKKVSDKMSRKIF